MRRFYDLSNYSRHRDAKSCVAAVSVDLQEVDLQEAVPTMAVTAPAVTGVTGVTGVTAVSAITGVTTVTTVTGETIKLEPVKLEPLQPLEPLDPAPDSAEQMEQMEPVEPAEPAAVAVTEMELGAEENSEFTSGTSAEDEFAEFARRYGEPAPVAVGDHVELQPVDAVELHALEPAVPSELPAVEAVEQPPAPVVGQPPAVLLPLTLAEPLVAGGQDVYVTLYPAGESNGHRFVCLQDGESTVFAEAPLIAEHVLNVN